MHFENQHIHSFLHSLIYLIIIKPQPVCWAPVGIGKQAIMILCGQSQDGESPGVCEQPWKPLNHTVWGGPEAAGSLWLSRPRGEMLAVLAVGGGGAGNGCLVLDGSGTSA